MGASTALLHADRQHWPVLIAFQWISWKPVGNGCILLYLLSYIKLISYPFISPDIAQYSALSFAFALQILHGWSLVSDEPKFVTLPATVKAYWCPF